MLNLLAVLNGIFEPHQFSMDIDVYNMLGFLTSLCIYGILGGPQDYIYISHVHTNNINVYMFILFMIIYILT